ncbi:MaoC family dehydratase [Crenobacter caeni]|uniref:MaoC family dehydratase n=1 Tax=Crenobacter caeni TaxID=2705474 RepID=A0A6B2KS03_9NEIS|nr:MaoC family dehydratase [Crenobacter caeni]NDV12739.1 MaoC family dehydratase [Crenobacter caeni]
MSAQGISFESIQVGEALPALEIPVSVELIVSGAIATRDFFPGHHDPEAARKLGSRHIFMNILTSNGLVERYVGGWAGPEALIGEVKIRLGAPNYPGDIMTMTGEVSAKDEAARALTVQLRGSNSMGEHVSGQVTLLFAEGAMA